MIIKFDRTPEELFKLSKEAFARGELDRALLYAEDAVRGKGCAEYKLSLAEVLLAMGRYNDAANSAMEALCYGTGLRAELYDILARVAGELGHFYESFHYLAKKAHYEGDDDTLDAMDAVIEELDAENQGAEDKGLFLVGKEEEKKPDPTTLLRANYALNHGEFAEAIRLAMEEGEGSEHYLEARNILLRAHLKRKDNERALQTAEELIKLEPKNGFVLHVLIVRFKKKEYIPLLSAVADGGSDIYYAILTAEAVGDHPLALRLSDLLLEANPYVPGAYFVAACARLNAGDKKGSEKQLSALFSIYRKYPREILLKGWRRLKKCDAGFSGRLPYEVVRILERYVLSHARDEEEFLASMLTDDAFRASLLFVLEEGEKKVTSRIVGYLRTLSNRHVDGFFAKVLLRYDVDLMLKREIFAALWLRKEKGSLFVAQSVVPVRVPCSKPLHYSIAPQSLRKAYAEVYSFLLCMTDARCEPRLNALFSRILCLDGAEDLSEEVILGAFLYRLLSEGIIPIAQDAPSEGDACRFLLQFIFGRRRVNMARVRMLDRIIAD